MFDWTAAAIVGLVSAVIGAASLFLAWRQVRERQLRKDDVLKWANEVIRNLQSLYLLCSLGERRFDADSTRAMLRQIAVDSSVLVEQGRLFFRNAPDPEHGQDKHSAYRGHRPELLDPLVVAHQIACRWDSADAAMRARMTMVAEDSVRTFVSLAQKEVGRSKTVSQETARGGSGDSLEARMAAISEKRLPKARG